jgi:hypothetical protein
MRGLPLDRKLLKARYDSGELVRESPPADAKRQRVDDSTPMRPAPAESARFLRMLNTREQIRLAKAAGAPWPWSDDDILNRHKFTNVKREPTSEQLQTQDLERSQKKRPKGESICKSR